MALSITLPPTSSYRLDQFGIYFRVVDPAWQRKIFPITPLVGTEKDGKIEVYFIWPDGSPSEQKPLELKVEAFFVTNGLDIGPSTVFEVKAPVGQH